METLCKNCNYPILDNYCGHCGQSKDTGRLTWSNFFANVAYGFTHINKGFWHTLVVLFRQPGTLYREYLTGKRQAYYRPFSLLVITAALYTVINRIALAYWKPVEVAAETVADKIAENQNMAWILLKGMGEWIINSGTALSACCYYRCTPTPPNGHSGRFKNPIITWSKISSFRPTCLPSGL